MAAATTERRTIRITPRDLPPRAPSKPSMGCAGCGDCCDPVILSRDVYASIKTRTQRNDPRNVAWVNQLVRDPNPLRQVSASEFNDGIAFQCPHFDREARLCGAHDARPPVCSGFPWYGGPPGSVQSFVGGRCSYSWDLPGPHNVDERRPLLPLWPK